MLPLKKFFRGIVITALLAQLCPAERNAPNTDRDGEDSWLIDRINLDSDQTHKLALLEKFVAEFPRHEGTAWAYEQIYLIAIGSKQLDLVLSAGEKLLTFDPDDIEIAQRNLDIAEAGKDPALIRKWSEITGAIAKRIIASPQPTETGQRRLKLARQLHTYGEYLAYTELLQAPKIERIEEFLRRNPDSPYTPMVQNLYLDTLLTVAQRYFQQDKEPETVLAYAGKILAAPVSPLSTPRTIGMAHWMIGNVSLQRGNYRQANKSMRAALPYLKGDEGLTSAALFYLGWANYQIGAVADAIRFNQACALGKGPFREQAAKNLAVIQAEQHQN